MQTTTTHVDASVRMQAHALHTSTHMLTVGVSTMILYYKTYGHMRALWGQIH